ncbi:MAG: cadmium-translocating P-type ATPase [Chloroflexi bacterium]|nr:cadmium-translocating P-type ATPase [Chloroflexota bacterium]MCI0579734.1 cadmium-translocating P-type ATPase [Chloroflexota bacterium]MCI0644246.1 cadmium-translocating P-type ATPase [Chloroflexota bacterium]MCI0727565.1 cadmium-translocating P-type ATPase [Chloroflexota bacterium]
MANTRTVELLIAGMDCAECTRHVQRALLSVPGVATAEVFLASEKAVLQLEREQVDLAALRQAVANAGYSVPETAGPAQDSAPQAAQANLSRQVVRLTAVVLAAVLFVVVVGEWLGLLERITGLVPWPVGLLLVLAGGYPIFRNVLRAALRRQITSHTLMTLGVVAALAVGEWATAVVIVFFMRVGDYVEQFTTGRARRAVQGLAALAPQTARLLRDGEEVEVPIAEVRVGDVVVVRPGEKLPVDGDVVAGQATVDQATITGESLPVEAGPGSRVYAASLAQLGSLRVRASHVGPDTTFGRIIRLVEEAEAHRADVQRFADRFTGYYLPIVAGLAALTLIIGRDPLVAAAVLVVACSCSIALATPIAMLASIGAAARSGLLIKGGKYLETVAQADVLLIDKTGTLTLGRPQLTDVIPLDGLDEAGLLALAAAAERYSEHPLAEAVRAAARNRNLPLVEPAAFEALPGLGVHAEINGRRVTVGSRRLLAPIESPTVAGLEAQGKTLLFVGQDGQLSGILAVADTLRPEVPAALAQVRQLGIRQIELLTGDNERAAADLAGRLGVAYRANLLPEEKIAIVREYQAQGRKVVMVGDGVNDAPALAQADVGVAMGAAGTDVALEAAHVALLRDDWTLVPELFRLARRTMGVVKMNLAFTAVYNLLGLSLAAAGLLPPILAAAAQSLPDLGILANSSRLLRGGRNGRRRTTDDRRQ